MQDLRIGKHLKQLNSRDQTTPKSNGSRSLSVEQMGSLNRNKAVDTFGLKSVKGGTIKAPNFFGNQMARSVTAGKFGVKPRSVFNW